MGRSYHSPKRKQSKEQTLSEILDAAVKLHGAGVTDLPSVAREAGVSLATVTKYFPTREHLFQGCTAHFLRQNPPPSPEDWGKIVNPTERLHRVVTDVHAVLEAAMGVSWSAYRLADQSPTMAANVRSTESFCQAAARILVGNLSVTEEEVGFISGLLGPLTYRSFRVAVGLSQEEVSQRTIQILTLLLHSKGERYEREV